MKGTTKWTASSSGRWGNSTNAEMSFSLSLPLSLLLCPLWPQDDSTRAKRRLLPLIAWERWSANLHEIPPGFFLIIFSFTSLNEPGSKSAGTCDGDAGVHERGRWVFGYSPVHCVLQTHTLTWRRVSIFMFVCASTRILPCGHTHTLLPVFHASRGHVCRASSSLDSQSMLSVRSVAVGGHQSTLRSFHWEAEEGYLKWKVRGAHHYPSPRVSF